MKYWTLLFFCLFFSTSTFAQKAGKWHLKKNKKDLKVYVRESPDSPFKELKMIFTVEATMSAIVELLQDVDAIPDWVYKCPEAYTITRINDNEEIYYNLIDFPWPLDDRDVVVKNTLVQDPVSKVIRSESFVSSGHVAEKPGIVRIEKLHLWWEFTPKADGKVEVEYYLKSDPGGYLPAWIVNMAIDQGPSQTVKSFRKILKEPKYKFARVDFISELDE